MNIASYFCPFSNKFHSIKDFKDLSLGKKLLTITAAALASLLFVGIGGVAVFRLLVGRFKPIDLKDPNREHTEAENVSERVNDIGLDKISNTSEIPPSTLESGDGSRPILIAEKGNGLSDTLTLDDFVVHPTVQDNDSLPPPDDSQLENVLSSLTSKPIIEYTREDVNVFREIAGSGKLHPEVQLQRYFIDQCRAGYSKALDLHETFKLNEGAASRFTGSQQILCSLENFKKAQGLLNAHFSELISLDFNKNTSKEIDYLLQIIMVGDYCEIPYGKNTYCVIELLRGVDAFREKENISLDCIDNIQQGNAEEVLVELGSIQKWLCESEITLVVDEFTERRSTVTRKDFSVPLKKQFIDAMGKSPDSVKKIINEAKGAGSIFTKLKELFPLENEEEELFSEELLKEIFRSSCPDEWSQENADLLNAWIEGCWLDEETVNKWAASSGCDVADVKSVYRIRMMQLLFFMSPSIRSQIKEGIRLELNAYENNAELIKDFDRFRFTVDSSDLFSSLGCEHSVEISLPDPSTGSFYNRHDAAFKYKETFAWIDSSSYSRETQPIKDLQFSWRVSESLLDHFVSRIRPDLLNQQLENKKERLLTGLSEEIAKLEEFNNQYSENKSIWTWLNPFAVQSVSKELEDVQQVAGLISPIIEKSYALLSTLTSQQQDAVGDESEEMAILIKVGDCLTQAKELINNKLAGQTKNDQQQVLEEVVNAIDPLVFLLPKSKGVKTYWERVQGALGETQEEGELAWKVHKYEAQILGLRVCLEQKFPELVADMDPLTMSMRSDSGWVRTQGDLAARRLYAILCDVEIDRESPDRYNQDYLAEIRGVMNERFIPGFRKVFRIDPDNIYLQEIASILFTELSLQEESFNTLELFNQLGAQMLGQDVEHIDENEVGRHPFVQKIHTVYKRLGAAPYSAKAPILNQWANSARGQWNRNFDPYTQGNPTHHFWNLKVGDRDVKMLGMGTPTNEDWWSTVSVNEEFIALMMDYKRKGKRHLTVNNQNMMPKNGWANQIINGDETNRCNALMELQNDERVEGAYYGITLSKNSSFYWQKGAWADRDNAKQFKSKLRYELIDGPVQDTGCYIPDTVRALFESEVVFDRCIGSMINTIHEHLFDNKDTLTVEERRYFIEQVYDNLTKMIIVKGGFDSVNISCKDQIDRGAGSNAQLYANCCLIDSDDGELTEEQEQEVLMVMMVRALFVRKRPPLSERVHRFAEGMDESFKNVDRLKNLHQALFGDTRFVPEML